MASVYGIQRELDPPPELVSVYPSSPVRERAVVSAYHVATDPNYGKLKELMLGETKVRELLSQLIQSRSGLPLEEILEDLRKRRGLKEGRDFGYLSYKPRTYTEIDYDNYFDKQKKSYHFTPKGRIKLKSLTRRNVPPEESLRYMKRGLEYYTTKKEKRARIPRRRFWDDRLDK